MQNMTENTSERSEGHKTPVERGSLPSRYIPRPQNPTRAPSYTLRRDGKGCSAIIRVLRDISAGPSEAMRQLQRGDLASRFITRAHKPTGAPFCTLHRDGKGARQLLCTFCLRLCVTVPPRLQGRPSHRAVAARPRIRAPSRQPLARTAP